MLSSVEFRERHRRYGVFVPIEEVPAHLACGWRIVEDVDRSPLHELLMAPPAAAYAGEAA